MVVCLMAIGSKGAAEDTPPANVAKPMNWPGEWVTPQDYPLEALYSEKSGVVAFVLKVDKGGKPTSCRIRRSSNVDELDAATCELVMARAKFFPAKDKNGHFVESEYRSAVRWQLPNTIPSLNLRFRDINN